MNDTVWDGTNAKDLSGMYSEIAEEFDVNTAYRIYKCFGGLQLTFPSKFYSNEWLCKRIHSEYNGSNVKAMAKKYGLSERRIRQIVSAE